jgi:hypothetical protein
MSGVNIEKRERKEVPERVHCVLYLKFQKASM